MKETIRPANRHETYLSEGIPLRTPNPIPNSVGGINIVKLFESLGKHDGSSLLDLLKEYIDNSFDWGSSKVTIRFDKKNTKIIITDDGYGMNIESFQKFCELWSDNDLDGQNEKVDGKFGIGVKKANRVLSDMQIVEIKTVKDKTMITGIIDYQKILSENKYDETSVPIEISDTSLSNGTEIIISTTDEIIIYFKDKYDSKKIDESLRFDLALTYNPKLMEGKEINLELYDESISFDEVISEKVDAIPFESDEFITKTYVVNLYKIGNRKTFTYALDSKTDIKQTCSHPYNSFNSENVCNYKNLKISLKFEAKFPKETKEFVVRKEGKEKKNICTINADSEITFYKDIKKIYNIEASNSKIMDYFKHIHVKRNTRVLARLNFDVKDVTSSRDTNIKNEYNCCLKTLSYSSSIDKHLPLAQETKSKVDWNKCPKGLKKVIELLIEKFVKCDVKTFMNEPIEGEDYSITDDEESEESEFETDSETDSETDVDDNLNGNVDANVDGNVDATIDANIDGNIDGNLDGNLDDNLDDYIDGNVDVNIDGNVDGNLDDNLDDYIDGNVDANIDGNVDGNVDANVDDYVDANIDGNVDATSKLKSNSMYLYAVTNMEDNKLNPLINEGKIEKKIGVTNQRISKRLSGGNEYKKNYEQDHKFKLNEIGCEFVSDKYNRSKHRVEVELYNKLVQIEGVTFLENSTEKFLCPIEKENEVQDVIIDIGRFFRQ